MPLYLGDKLISGRSKPIDAEPIENSLNLVTSGGVKKYVDDKVGTGTISGSGIAIQPEEPSDTDVWIDLDDDEIEALDIVTSFNGRDGEVVPEAGDYTAEMVGAIPDGGAQVSGDYTLQGDITVGQLYADILNVGNEEDGVYIEAVRDYNNVLHFSVLGRTNDDPVRLGAIDTPVAETDAANKLYVDSTKLVVTASYSEVGGFFERSHTNEEIIAAIQEGRYVRLDVHFEDEEAWHTYHLSDSFNDGAYRFTWTDGWSTLANILVYSDDTIWELESNILTPGNIGAATMAEVNAAIAAAIGSAIGGSY